ncbi:MAG: biotin-dependent carboxyltransferase family protein [Bryobacteraceae bacterium]
MHLNRLRVVSPGLLTTVQDLGRPGYAHLGISASGAADALSLRAGNLLVGNAEGAAALEMTMAGGTFEFESRAVVALTGADFEASIPMWTAVEVKPGEQVRCGHARSGARCYLCVNGGIEIPLVLGSASTHLLTGLGGLEGRALKRGDVLACGARTLRAAAPLVGTPPADRGSPRIIRVTSPASAEALCGPTWEVHPDSDRMGLRLRGPTLHGHTGHMITEGVPLGAVQVPPDGQPIILFVEHQTTGGYPKIANVISADFHAVGQLRPRDRVRFERVSMDAALALLDAQEDWLRSRM